MRKQTINKTLESFSEFVEKDLDQRLARIKILVERGDAPIGSISNEKSFGDIIRSTLKEYTLRFFDEND